VYLAGVAPCVEDEEAEGHDELRDVVGLEDVYL
jgi:hypothetical protein